jgi:hypothetical protein
MLQQILWLETLLKASGAFVLLLAPLSACHLLGLPKPQTALWPRLLGAVLLGLAAATYAEGIGWDGLGLVGLILVNLIAAAVILVLLVLAKAAPTARGSLTLGVLAGLLSLLSLVEIAFI